MRSGEQQFDASELMVPRVLHYPPLSDYPSRWPAQADDDGPALHPNHFRVESVLNTAWKSLAKDCNRREGVQAPPLLAPVVVVVGVGWALGTGHLLLLPSPPLLSFLLFSSSPLPPPAAPPPSHIPLPVLGHPRSSLILRAGPFVLLDPSPPPPPRISFRAHPRGRRRGG